MYYNRPEEMVLGIASKIIRRLFDVLKYFIDKSKNIKAFFFRINFSKHIINFSFCCCLPFYSIVNISVIVSIFMNFYCEPRVMKI